MNTKYDNLGGADIFRKIQASARLGELQVPIVDEFTMDQSVERTSNFF